MKSKVPIKDILISIRVDREAWALLEKAANKAGRRMSDYVRTAAVMRALREKAAILT